uniref:Embigin n=1 Tax=Neogobius melanostomus TaxID=47308 RepID=A0A8C6UPA9_9GOBI
MSVSCLHFSSQLLLLLSFHRHVNTISENTTSITEPRVETPAPKTPPLAPLIPTQTAQRNVLLTGENHTEEIEVVNPVVLNLECIWPGNGKRLPNITGYWTKDGQTIETSYSNIQLENDLYRLIREFTIMNEDDLGNYSCLFGPKAKVKFIVAAPHLGEVRDKPIVSYVGDSVVMVCKMDEKKPQPISWNWYIQNGTNKVQIESDSNAHKYKITKDGNKTKLLVYNLTESDSGVYYCGAVYAVAISMGYMQLRVITYYEPLKPFMGILAEVVILVAVILLYEKIGSRKHGESAGTEENKDETNNLSHRDNDVAVAHSSTRQRKV